MLTRRMFLKGGGVAFLDYNGDGLLDILELPLPLETNGKNTLVPRALPLSAEARRLWIGFYDHVERRVASGGELEPVRGLAMPASVCTEHGITAMPSVLKEPDEIDAPMSPGL